MDLGLVRVLTWNLFHGRDAPPDERLHTRRSRILGTPERGEIYAQVNRSLLAEFSAALAGEDWDVALLQEVPPRWLRPLCRAGRASGASALTARNLGAPLRALGASRPDLLASWEGGSNQLLVRAPWRLEEVRRLTLTRRPERRRMLWARLASADAPAALAVANLHGSITGRGPERDLERAAEAAGRWAEGLPLVLGGDLNLRPSRSPEPFEKVLERTGLGPPGPPDAVDHLLGRGLRVVEAPRLLPEHHREVRAPEGLLRLSDHAPVVASFALTCTLSEPESRTEEIDGRT